MKKMLFLAAMLLCVSLSYSQEPIRFLGIDWGISQEKIIAEMASRGFSDYLIFSDSTLTFRGKIAGGEGTIDLSTYQDKFYKASVLVTTYISAKEMAKILIEKYGSPSKAYEDIVYYYTWDLQEKGSLRIIETGEFISLDYLDGVIEMQKKRDELAGL